MSRRRHRSAAYRLRRRIRTAARRNRESERRDYFYMLERAPGYAGMLERYLDEELAEEWEAA